MSAQRRQPAPISSCLARPGNCLRVHVAWLAGIDSPPASLPVALGRLHQSCPFCVLPPFANRLIPQQISSRIYSLRPHSPKRSTHRKVNVPRQPLKVVLAEREILASSQRDASTHRRFGTAVQIPRRLLASQPSLLDRLCRVLAHQTRQ